MLKYLKELRVIRVFKCIDVKNTMGVKTLKFILLFTKYLRKPIKRICEQRIMYGI